MSAILEAKAVITATDQTKGAFDSLENRIKAASRQTKSLGAAMASIGRVSGPMSQVTGSIGRAEAAISAFGASTRAVDAVSASIAKAEKAFPKLSREAQALAKVTAETAQAGRRFTAEIGRIDAAAGRLQAFKALQTGFGETRRAFFAAKQQVQDLAAQVERSDGRIAVLRRRREAALAADMRAKTTYDAAPHPTRLDAADADRFNAVRAARADAATSWAKAHEERRAADHALAAAENGPETTKLRREYAEAQKAVSLASGALDQQKSALVAVRREMEELVGGPIKSLSGAEAALKAQAEGVNHAMIEQAHAAHAAAETAHSAAERRMRRTERFRAAGEVAGELLPFAGPEVLSLTREAMKEGAALQHERIGLVNAGRTPEEIERIEARSREVSGALPTASMEDNLKVISETTSAFGTLDHAIEHLKFMQQTMAVLKSAGGEHIHGTAGDVGRDFAKFFEERLTKPEDFEREARQMIPAMVASGGTFNPREMYLFAQQAKSALPNYDMDFLSRIAPSLITAQGGERAGTAANAFNSIVMGKVNDKKQAEAWLAAGLLDPSKTIMKAGHAVGWSAGAVTGTDLALSNPLKWAEEVALPHLRDRLHIDTDNRLELAKALGTMFRNQNGNMFANEIMQAASRARLHKDSGLYNQVGDLEALYDRNLYKDPQVGLRALGEAIKSFAGIATSPVMESAAQALGTTAVAVAHFGEVVGDFAHDHPKVAEAGATAAAAAVTGLGLVLSGKLFSGLGSLLKGGGATALAGSATLLDGSAEALSGAALALREAAAASGLAGKTSAAASAAGGAASAAEDAAGPTLLRSAILAPEAVEALAGGAGLGIAAGIVGLVKASAAAQEPGQGGQWAAPTAATEDLDRQRLSDQNSEAADLRRQIAENEAHEKLPGSSVPINAPLKDRLAQLEGEIALLESRLANLRVSPDREAEVGRGLMAFPAPEAPYPDREAARGRAYAGLPRSEPFGPFLPSGTATVLDGNALRHADGTPSSPPPPPDRNPREARSKDDAVRIAPAPSGAPIPVHVVSASGSPSPPLGPGLHRDFTLGNLSGGFASPGLGAGEGFQPFPNHRAPAFTPVPAEAVKPDFDFTALDAALGKTHETAEALKGLAGLAVAPRVDMAAIDALIAKLMQAKSLIAGLGSTSGTTGSSGPSRVVASPGVGKSR